MKPKKWNPWRSLQAARAAILKARLKTGNQRPGQRNTVTSTAEIIENLQRHNPRTKAKTTQKYLGNHFSSIKTEGDVRPSFEAWKESHERWREQLRERGRTAARLKRGVHALSHEELSAASKKSSRASNATTAKRLKEEGRGIFGLTRKQLQDQAAKRDENWLLRMYGRIPKAGEIERLRKVRLVQYSQLGVIKTRQPFLHPILKLTIQQPVHLPLIKTEKARKYAGDVLSRSLPSMEYHYLADLLGITGERRLTLNQLRKKYLVSSRTLRKRLNEAIAIIGVAELKQLIMNGKNHPAKK